MLNALQFVHVTVSCWLAPGAPPPRGLPTPGTWPCPARSAVSPRLAGRAAWAWPRPAAVSRWPRALLPRPRCGGVATRVTFWHSAGEGTTPLTITGDGHEQSPTRANPPPLLQPSRWWQLRRETSEIRSATRIPSASRCNHSSNALGFSKNLTKMMDQ